MPRILRQVLATLAVLLPVLHAPLRAQAAAPDTVSREATAVAPPANIKWWHVGAGVALTALTIETLDGPVQRWTQRHRSGTKDDVASVLRQPGAAPVYLGAGGAVVLAGLVTGRDEVTRSGGRMLASVVLAQVFTQGTKRVLGRARPFEGPDEKTFNLFGGGDASLPSGHATGAFALATALSHELHSTPATIALYTVAAGTAWSRLNDNQHWLSDVLVGGAFGVAGAQFVYGKWTVFGIRPPRFLMTPRGAALAWSGTF